jgi:hypothetical protein
MALNAGTTVRKIDVKALQRKVRAAGGDPGDVPAPNANTLQAAE